MTCPFKPKIARQTTDSITLEWSCIDNCEVYKVVHSKHQPTFVNQYLYWGTAPRCTIKGLDDNFCYYFKIFALRLEDNAYKPLSESEVITAHTLPNVPNTISLHRAIRKSQEYVLKRILSTSTELIDVPGPNGITPLVNAVATGNKDLVDILLRFGVNVNVANSFHGRTALHVAVFHGHVTIAKILVDHRADIFHRDAIGLTAGHYAIDGGHLPAVKFAMELYFNAETEAPENMYPVGWSALLWRAVEMHCDSDLVELILTYRKDKMECADEPGIAEIIRLAEYSGQTEMLELLKVALSIEWE